MKPGLFYLLYMYMTISMLAVMATSFGQKCCEDYFYQTTDERVKKKTGDVDSPGAIYDGGGRGIVVIVVGNGHGDTSSNPGRDWLHFI